MADADVALAAHGVAELAEASVLLGHHELRRDVPAVALADPASQLATPGVASRGQVLQRERAAGEFRAHRASKEVLRRILARDRHDALLIVLGTMVFTG